MKRLSLCLLLLAIVFTIPVLAENNTVLNVHVEKAVAVPGNVLEPGDYVFRLADIANGRSVVRIESADSKINYGFVHIYSTQRASSGESEVKVASSGSAGVDRIDSWFFPGEQHGYRFIYSKADVAKSAQLAQKVASKANMSGF